MEGIIASFKRGRHHQQTNQAIVNIASVTSKEAAEKLIGKNTKFVSTGKEPKQIRGRVAAAHGNSGAIRVVFVRGLPGQALGSKLKFE